MAPASPEEPPPARVSTAGDPALASCQEPVGRPERPAEDELLEVSTSDEAAEAIAAAAAAAVTDQDVAAPSKQAEVPALLEVSAEGTTSDSCCSSTEGPQQAAPESEELPDVHFERSPSEEVWCEALETPQELYELPRASEPEAGCSLVTAESALDQMKASDSSTADSETAEAVQLPAARCEVSEDGAVHKTVAEERIAETAATPWQCMQSDSGVVNGHVVASLKTDTNGDESNVEQELEALQHVVAVLAEQLRTLSAEVDIDEDSILAESPEQDGVIPDWEPPTLGSTGASVTHLARWYVDRLTCPAAAAAECPGPSCDPATPSASSNPAGSACEAEAAMASSRLPGAGGEAEADGAVHLVAELGALEEWFNKAVSTAAVLLEKRDRCFRLSEKDSAGRAGKVLNVVLEQESTCSS